MRFVVALVFAILGAGVFSGCTVNLGDSASDGTESLAAQLESLEGEIKGDLGRQLRNRYRIPVRVIGVDCTGTGGNRFECLARASAGQIWEGNKTEVIPITGACDSRSCLWRVAGY